MNGIDPKPKRRKYRLTKKEAGLVENMAAAPGKSGNKESKDSPSAPKANSNPSFPAGPSVFGAPTYFPTTNPWQNEQNNKLDFIVEKLTKMERNQNTFLVRLGEIENKLVETNQKVVQIENSQSHLSNQFDDINSTTRMHKVDIQKLQGEVKTLSEQNVSLKQDNQKMKDDVIDLKCRSMRDNLLFFGIPESASMAFDPNSLSGTGAAGGMAAPGGNIAMEQSGTLEELENAEKSAEDPPAINSFAKVVQMGENCAEKVYEFCEKVLNIPNPKSKIQIDRAHRIGVRSPGKIRPIVAKFVLSEHKAFVKSALSKVNLKDPPYNGQFKVNDQFPPEVIERRKELIPKLLSERRKGNKATLVRDKLYVNNRFVE